MANVPNFNVELIVTPRPGVRDPQGEAVQEALRSLGHAAVEVGCVGRVLRLRLSAPSSEAARTAAARMCDELLVNPSLETYELRIEAA
jgi:phosphoribosylformylglycinamidine synthase PurS subunit